MSQLFIDSTTNMEHVNYITISDNEDEDEVEVLDHVIKCEPIIVDLTSTPKNRRVLEELTEQPPRPPWPHQPPQEHPKSPPNPCHKPAHSSFSSDSSSPSRSPSPQIQSAQEPTPAFHEQPQAQHSQTFYQSFQPSHCSPPHPEQPQDWQPNQQQQPDEAPQESFCEQPTWQPVSPPSQAPPQPSPQPPPPPPPPPPQTEPTRHNFEPQTEQPPIPQAQPQPEPLPQAKPVKRPLSDQELMIAKKEQGNKKFRCNALDDAVRCYREALDLSRKLEDKDMAAVLHFNLAMSYDKLGSYTQAADECAAAVKINDNYVKAHVKRAEIYMARRKYEEAVICYEHICEIDSTKRNDAMQRIAKAKALAASMRKPDQYEILNLRPHFTAAELKAAYKQKARTHHPDRHSDADIVTRRIHERIFKEASEANTYFRKRFNFH